MGFIGKTIEGTYVLVVSMCYGVLFSLGMLSTILGILVLNSDVPLPTSGPLTFMFGGTVLMMVTTFALLALWYRQWLWLLISEGVFAFLLVIIYASSIVAVCLALELESPVATAIEKAWKETSGVRLEMHQNWCLRFEDFEELAVCDNWRTRINAFLLSDDLDNEACPYTRLQLAANCSLIDPDHHTLQAQACAPQADDEDLQALFDDCQICDQTCRDTFIDTISQHLYPVSVVAYTMVFFVAVTALWNSFVVLEHATRKDEDGNTVAAAIEGFWALASYFFNGTVNIAGILLLVVGLLLMRDAQEDCRRLAGDEAADLECADPPVSFLALIALGVVLVVCAVISTIGVQKTATKSANFVWVNLLRITQIVYTVAGMLLLAAAIVFSLSSGALETVNSQYLSRFEGIRDHLDNANPNYCRYQEGSGEHNYDSSEGSSWRSPCRDRIDCTDTERANRNCAWDEEMYEAIHTSDSPVAECSTQSKPVKDGDSQCKYLANLVADLHWTEISESFANAEEGSRQQLAQASCSEAVQETFDQYGRCMYSVDPALNEDNDRFDCRRCFPNQQFSGTGNEALCNDNQLEVEMMFQSTAMSCEILATAGMCHFPVKVFNTFLDGVPEGNRKIYEICTCACRANNEDIYDSGGANTTCINVMPAKEEDRGALDTILDTTNLAASRIRLGSNVDCGVFTDPENQCPLTLETALTALGSQYTVPAEVSNGAKAVKVSEWCRELCCGVGLAFGEDEGCGECGSDSLATTRNVTAPIDAETLCFLDVVAYVRADSDASDDCREAVRDAYPGNTGAPVREAICHMTDYDCRNRIKYDTAQNMTIVAIVAAVIVGFIIVTMFFTLRTLYLFRPPTSSAEQNSEQSKQSRERDGWEQQNPVASRDSTMVPYPSQVGDET